ncbi:DUF2249 domain-containing protein [Pontibacter chitinilyticus]|uniref:DUF2249 domain-containing protein n=1 Tax=Pontibacter chitinilyticus TaxID=2674989 RepID=UPI0032193A13
MKLAADTKISAIIKANPAAIEIIAGISSHFEKLRNPLLRKLLTSRVSIGDAARIGGCQVDDFFQKLGPLGFTVNEPEEPEKPEVRTTGASKPGFLQQLSPDKITTLDVRPQIASGQDPYRSIILAVNALTTGQALLLVNTFEPTPLLTILQKKGFSHFVEKLCSELVYTYFWRATTAAPVAEETPQQTTEDTFEDKLASYTGKMRRVDVRQLEMPKPMITILQELERLTMAEALYVLHKRVPQYLLLQLQERGFAISIKEAGPGEVYLLIYKI